MTTIKNIIILLPPSEGKKNGGKHKPVKLSPSQQEVYERLMHAQTTYSTEKLEKLFGVKSKALRDAMAANETLTTSTTLPAIERYTGVVYDGINYASLSPSAQEYLQENVYIMSALFGLIQAEDTIPNYKCKIDSLKLAQFWHEKQEPFFSSLSPSILVLDLLPKAHKKAIPYEAVKHYLQAEFVIKKDGKKKPAGHFGKLVKGKFVRWLCETRLRSTEDLEDFSADGFVFSSHKDNVIEFVKNEK